MKTPEHHFINEYGQHEIKRMWLGSGVTDKNGKEIFEGDKVIFGDLEFQGVVTCRNGALGITFKHFCKERFTTLYDLIGFTEFEIVGHVTDTAEEQQ